MEKAMSNRACCRPVKTRSADENSSGLYIYSLPVSILLGFQYAVVALLFVLHYPLQTLSSFCLLPDDSERGVILCKILLVSGLATLSQALFGTRSPLVIAPSMVFMTVSTDFLRSGLWGKYSDGDLYAMGHSLRRSEYIGRTMEMEGIMILGSFLASLCFGALWYFRVKLPSATVYATVITACISNTLHFFSNTDDLMFGKAFLLQLSFFTLIVFYVGQNIELPYLKVIINADRTIKLKVFQIFAVLFTFIIIIIVNIKYEFEVENLLERAAIPHGWLTFDFIPKDFHFPVISSRGLIVLPTFISKSLVSYCCYSLILNNKGRLLLAFLLESFWNVVSPGLGVFLPLSVDPASIGLSYLTEVQNGECSVISGSLLIVMSLFIKIAALSAFAPHLMLSGIVMYLYGQLIIKVIVASKEKSDENVKVMITSIMAGMVISTFDWEEDNTNIYITILLMILKNNVLFTFVFSLLIALVFKKHESSKRRDIIGTIV